MAEETKPFKPQVKAVINDGAPKGHAGMDYGSSYAEFMRQVQIAEDEALVKEAFELQGVEADLPDTLEGAFNPQPEGFDFQGSAGTQGDDALNEAPNPENLNALGIAHQILVGGGLDAVNNTANLVTDLGEWVRNFELGGATVEQHLQDLDAALGTEGLFSGKVEVGIGTLDKKGGAAVQLARGVAAWLAGFAATRSATGAGNIVSGIAADGLAIDRDANLANLFNDTFPEGHPLRNPIIDALAVSADDTELEKSIKSILEGAGLALPFTVIQALSKSLSKWKKVRVQSSQVTGNVEPGLNVRPARSRDIPQVSTIFDGREYNITDMELRFDEVNSQRVIDKVQKKFDDIAEEFRKNPDKELNKKGRKKRTLAETELQARKELQADPEGQLKEIMEKDPTSAITDKDRTKIALFQEASVRKLIELRNSFKAGDSTAVQKAFDHAKFTADLFEQAQRFSETSSRDLGSGKIVKALKRTEGNIIVDKFDVVKRDVDPNISPESFMRKLDAIEGATDSVIEKMLSKWFGETVRLGGFDMFFEAWVNSLFGFKTQVVNGLGSTINMGFQVAEAQLAAGIRKAKRGFGATGKGVEEGEAFDMLYGILTSAPENVRALAKNTKNIFTGKEVNTSRFNKLNDEGIRAIRGSNVPGLAALKDSGSRSGNVLYKGVDVLGHVLTVQGKGMLTVDEFFKFAAYNASKRRLARRLAIQEGITRPDALEMRIRQLVAEPPPSIKAESEEFARLATFTDEAGEIGKLFQALLKAAPASRLVVPFFNVLNNVAKFTGSRTPLALFSKSIRDDLLAGGIRADMAQARLASGTMVSLAFLSLAMGGGITGSEPTNPAHKASFRRKKKQPYSIEFRHEDGTRTSISINRLEPAAFFAAIMADFVRISGELEDGEIDSFVGAYALAISRHFLSQTFATGVADFMNLAMEGDYKFLKNLGASMMPFNGVMADIEKTVDPALRDTKTFDRTIMEKRLIEQLGENEGKAMANSLSELTKVLARFKSRSPLYSKDLPARLDEFGEVKETEYGFENPVINTLNPFAVSTIKPNKLEDWITAVDANIVEPEPQMEGIKLTPQEFHDWKKMAGPKAKKALEREISDPRWKLPASHPDHVKDVIKKAKLEMRFREEYQKAQRKMLSRSNPILDKDGELKYFDLIKAVERERAKNRTIDKTTTSQPMDF
ncbi:MAG: hypothetical protein ACPGRH_06720 [Alphaproteobacteria bacterium]